MAIKHVIGLQKVPPTDQHEELLAERGAEYGDSYARTDEWVRKNLSRLAASPSPLGLIMMHFNLERALQTPNNRDHYDDLIGYAKLALREIDRQRPEVHWLPSMGDHPDDAALIDPEYAATLQER